MLQIMLAVITMDGYTAFCEKYHMQLIPQQTAFDQCA